jgi:hypothetical protein
MTHTIASYRAEQRTRNVLRTEQELIHYTVTFCDFVCFLLFSGPVQEIAPARILKTRHKEEEKMGRMRTETWSRKGRRRGRARN